MMIEAHLAKAAESGDAEAISSLLLEAEANSILLFGTRRADHSIARTTPAHIAAAKGHDHVLEALFYGGMEVDLPAGDGATPLFRAVVSCPRDLSKGTVLCLLSKRVNVNHGALHGDSALFHATKAGRLDLVELLINSGADADAATHHGTTPLMVAAERGNLALVKLLLKPRRHHKGRSGKLVVGCAVDPFRASCSGTTALVSAAERGHLAIVQCLLSAMTTLAASSPPSSPSSPTSLSFLLSPPSSPPPPSSPSSPSVAPKLSATGPQGSSLVDARTLGGTTALFAACANGWLTVAQSLLQWGADPNATYRKADGAGPLHVVLDWAAANQSFSIGSQSSEASYSTSPFHSSMQPTPSQSRYHTLPSRHRRRLRHRSRNTKDSDGSPSSRNGDIIAKSGGGGGACNSSSSGGGGANEAYEQASGCEGGGEGGSLDVLPCEFDASTDLLGGLGYHHPHPYSHAGLRGIVGRRQASPGRSMCAPPYGDRKSLSLPMVLEGESDDDNDDSGEGGQEDEEGHSLSSNDLFASNSVNQDRQHDRKQNGCGVTGRDGEWGEAAAAAAAASEENGVAVSTQQPRFDAFEGVGSLSTTPLSLSPPPSSATPSVVTQQQLPRLLKLLLDCGADPHATLHATGETPLHCACRLGLLGAVKILARRTNVRCVTSPPTTPTPPHTSGGDNGGDSDAGGGGGGCTPL